MERETKYWINENGKLRCASVLGTLKVEANPADGENMNPTGSFLSFIDHFFGGVVELINHSNGTELTVLTGTAIVESSKLADSPEEAMKNYVKLVAEDNGIDLNEL